MGSGCGRPCGAREEGRQAALPHGASTVYIHVCRSSAPEGRAVAFSLFLPQVVPVAVFTEAVNCQARGAKELLCVCTEVLAIIL